MVVEGLLVAVGAFTIGYLLIEHRIATRAKAVEKKAQELLEQAQNKSRELLLEARDQAMKLKDEVEAENRKQLKQIQREDRYLQRRRESLDRRLEQVETQTKRLEAWEKELQERRAKLEQLEHQELAELERLSGLTQEQARELLLDNVREKARQDVARIIREAELLAEEEANQRARKIISIAIQRCASEEVAETTICAVPLPNDEMKGRIIGRSGRNIRAIEKATGVDLVVDDTPEAVLLSCFDPVRREVARLALTRLISDGRIHPGRIEKVVEDSKAEVEAIIQQEGEQVAIEMGLPRPHPELIMLLGTLKFRTSFGQNVLQHSIETAHLAAMMAAELGGNVALAKEAGLLHDIGKAIDHKVEGSHALIGANIARQAKKPEVLVNAIAAHHDEEEPQTVEAILVQVADAISGARPGARRETLETYIRRIEALEGMVNSFPGVSEAYAIQAGREVRIIVKPEEVDDLAAIQLSKDIARKAEESLEYPGQIKVTVIRETRAVDYAR